MHKINDIRNIKWFELVLHQLAFATSVIGAGVTIKCDIFYLRI